MVVPGFGKQYLRSTYLFDALSQNKHLIAIMLNVNFVHLASIKKLQCFNISIFTSQITVNFVSFLKVMSEIQTFHLVPTLFLFEWSILLSVMESGYL